MIDESYLEIIEEELMAEYLLGNVEITQHLDIWNVRVGDISILNLFILNENLIFSSFFKDGYATICSFDKFRAELENCYREFLKWKQN